MPNSALAMTDHRINNSQGSAYNNKFLSPDKKANSRIIQA